jgi:iron complex outermembrane recepter protein
VRHADHQTNGLHNQSYYKGVANGKILTQVDFADTQAHHQENHAVLDFMAGKDVGLGMFGRGSSSTLNFGVRFAQFESKASVDMRARPDLQFFYYPSAAAPTRAVLPYFHTYHATGHASRDFRGVGPSLSWSGSTPFVGNQQDGELTLDWGANAAILFGKQTARVRHHETAHYHSFFATFVLPQYAYVLTYNHATPIPDRSRSVTVPNVGGSVGLSWRVENFKASIGYRYDTFLKAMDAGIDARKTSNLTFNGPYASISVGLGD